MALLEHLLSYVKPGDRRTVMYDPSPYTYTYSIVRSGLMQGHTETIPYFIEYGPLGSSPDIMKAARKEYIDTVKLLISGMEKYESYRTILEQAPNGACAAGHRAVAEYLVLAGASVNASVGEALELWDKTNKTARGFRKIKESLVMRQEPIIKLLLENGVNVNLIAGYEKPPLHSAVLNSTEEIVQAMIEHGANVHTPVPKDGTPLQCAASREVGSLRIVLVLLEAGADITIEDSQYGLSSQILEAALMHFSSQDGHFIQSDSLQDVLKTGPGGIIKLILQSKSELQAKDERFNLVLQTAAAAGNEDLFGY
ncbi:hypothetical protein AJ80_01237 [Polytolypa hystricis UAMH7299]|uniref:Uncharacterized protein n=1 Tax=Polytolypa hystricis (strain UAMH7299) TaxID=1447883 RepID=A0A2B7Z149_POLH7|nr:hypothetical protein AJ80_01237 [Polytolypa hystricis UAMH7299]